MHICAHWLQTQPPIVFTVEETFRLPLRSKKEGAPLEEARLRKGFTFRDAWRSIEASGRTVALQSVTRG